MNNVKLNLNGVSRRSPDHFISHLQLGYTFQKSAESNFSITPQLVVLVTTPYRQHIDGFKSVINSYVEGYHLNFRYKKTIWGVNNAGIHLGRQTERFRVMLTVDPGYFNEIRDNNPIKSYTGNLSLRYVFKENSRD